MCRKGVNVTGAENGLVTKEVACTILPKAPPEIILLVLSCSIKVLHSAVNGKIAGSNPAGTAIFN